MKNALTILLLFCITAIYGQDKKSTMNTIDFGSGMTFSSVNINEHPGKTIRSNGADISLRYTRFFNEHWGAYIEGEYEYNTVKRSRYFGKVKSLDNGTYKYNWFKTGATTPELSFPGIFAGCVYRYDINRWSLRPRVGIGMTDMLFEKSRYYRPPVKETDAERQAVMIHPAATDKEGEDFSRILAACKAGMQFNYSLSRHFHIGADLDLTIFMQRHEYTTRIYNTQKEEGIKDVGSAIIGILLMTPLWKEDYKRTELVSEQKTNCYLHPIASVRFVLGWDF